MSQLRAIMDKAPSTITGRGAVAKRCYYCGHTFDVAPKAQTAGCPSCNRHAVTSPIVVKALHWGGAIHTCDTITIQRRARASAHLAVASEGVTILGSLEGDVISGGHVHLGPAAILRGGVTAPSITIDPGAIIEHGNFRILDQPIGALDIAKALSTHGPLRSRRPAG